ncbi:MAG: glycosyltransferase family 9 protein [Gallionellaceae bacterium]|nr:glycosyltransferase family 9 protein [Gallionellaceae bacterium]
MSTDLSVPERTLMIQPLPGIGDMVWYLPHLHALAAASPHGRISILTKPRSFADRLLSADRSVDDIVWLKRNPGEHDGLRGFFRLVGQLRRGRYNQAWILHVSPRYAMATWLAGIPARVGYGVGWQKLFLNHTVQLPKDFRRAHAIDKATQLLRLFGVDDIEDEPRLRISPEAEAAVASRFGDSAHPWLAIGLGSSGAFKQWGADNFAALITRFAGTEEATIFLIGGPQERQIAEQVLAQLDRKRLPRMRTATDLPLEQTVALLARCHLFVGNDTGVLNIAAATGVHSIGLFGSTPPLRHTRHIHPVIPDDNVVPATGSNNMAGISVDNVLAKALALWRTEPEPAGPMITPTGQTPV